MKVTTIKLNGKPRDGEQLPRAFGELSKTSDNTVQAIVMTPIGEEFIDFQITPDTPAADRRRTDDAITLAKLLDGSDYNYRAILQLIDILRHMG